MAAMKFSVIIKKDGMVVTEVVDRGTSAKCSEILKVTSRLGREVSDEHIGPECDTVNEIQQ